MAKERQLTLHGHCLSFLKQIKVFTMITYTTVVEQPETKTCSTCPNFNNLYYSKSKGWCELFNLPARSFHQKTNDCILSDTSTVDTESNLGDIFANYSSKELEELREAAFPTEVIELDREGYPMSEDTVANAYFDPNFVSLPNEPF